LRLTFTTSANSSFLASTGSFMTYVGFISVRVHAWPLISVKTDRADASSLVLAKIYALSLFSVTINRSTVSPPTLP
jgi:hypothetical protein